MKTAGLGMSRLAIAPTIIALGVFVLSICLNMEWVPRGERTFKELLIKVGNTRVVSSIKAGTFTSGFFDLLIFADKVDNRTNQLRKVFIYDEREPKNPLTVVAHAGEIVSVKTPNELSAAALLKLYDGSIHKNEAHTSTYQKIDFGEYKLFLRLSEGTADSILKPHMITHKELLKRISNTQKDSYEGREMRGEYWRRYAIAISPLIFVFLGMGLGSFRNRSVRAGAAITSLVILVVYWTIQTWATLTLLKGQLNPLLAMQLPNIVMAIGAFFAFKRSQW